MRTGFLILLSFAMALAPAAPVFACAVSVVPAEITRAAEITEAGGITEAGETNCDDTPTPMCCCGPAASTCNCAGCAEHTSASPGGDNAERGCACDARTPRSNETAKTTSIGDEHRLSIGDVVVRDGAQQEQRFARIATVVRRDQHPQVRQPLLL
jgi:hypothetical protein